MIPEKEEELPEQGFPWQRVFREEKK